MQGQDNQQDTVRELMVKHFVAEKIKPYELNHTTLLYLIHYLQSYTKPEIISLIKMTEANLATIFAPNVLRCPSKDPRVLAKNLGPEKAFMMNLIKWLDTSEADSPQKLYPTLSVQ